MFRFEQQDRGEVLVLELQGSLDAMTAAEFKPAVVAIAAGAARRVVVDLQRLTLIDSTGVGVLISLFKRMRAREGTVAFAGLGGQPREVFRLLRLDRSLDLYPTTDEAVQGAEKG
jgi:anti-sigma B factor antagonist